MKPMLAASMDKLKGETLHELNYPQLASAKLDGIRCLNVDGTPLSRTFKPIPNAYVRRKLSFAGIAGLDGELMVGESFQSVTSGIMSADGTPDFTFYVFDDFSDPTMPYELRVARYAARVEQHRKRLPFIRAIETKRVRCATELEDFTAHCLSLGYEGAMVRNPLGHYKFGRATFKEGLLTKIKPFEDAEGEIIGFEEAMENRNEAQQDAFGRTKRSTHKANKHGKGTLGAFICRNEKLWPGVTFNVGTGKGLTAELRQMIWDNQDYYRGQWIRFTYQAAGTKDRPRIASFQGFRHPDDL